MATKKMYQKQNPEIYTRFSFLTTYKQKSKVNKKNQYFFKVDGHKL